MALPNRPGNLAGAGILPIINVGARARGFAGLISDASLLDVETVVYDRTITDDLHVFRAGTVAIVTGVNAKTGTRKGRFAKASDVAAAAGVGKRFVAVSFSHDTCDQSSEIYARNPDQSGVVNVKPANGVNTGRVWLFLNGSKPSADGRAGVSVADVPAAGAFDATKPYVNGAVKVATGSDATANGIPGWYFTGVVDIDPATGYQIAEVEIKRA